MSKKLDWLTQSWRDYNGFTPTVELIIDHARALEEMLKANMFVDVDYDCCQECGRHMSHAQDCQLAKLLE